MGKPSKEGHLDPTKRLILAIGLSQTSLPGGHSGVEPPDPIPNSEVKRTRADGSVRSPHVRVGHCQAFNT